jgi:hypothetical protein
VKPSAAERITVVIAWLLIMAFVCVYLASLGKSGTAFYGLDWHLRVLLGLGRWI